MPGGAGSEDLLEAVQRGLQSERDASRRIHSRPNTAAVDMNISPSLIPLNTFNPMRLLQGVADAFSSRLDLERILSRLPPGTQIDSETAMRIAVSNEELIGFTGGWLKLEDDSDVTPIERFAIGPQQISSVVNGTSTHAEFVCQRLLTMIWDAAGVPNRRWRDFEHQIDRYDYRTSTIVDLGKPLVALLSSELRSFLDDDIANSYGRSMASVSQRVEDVQHLRVVTTYGREIELRVVVVDEVSGEVSEAMLDILLHSRSDANRTTYKVASALPTHLHQAMIEKLVSAI